MFSATKNITSTTPAGGHSGDQGQALFDSYLPATIDLPAGKVVTSWVKVENDEATCNLPANHGYTNGNFDVYFPEGGGRFGVPGTISTNALTLNGGAGDAFPNTATAGIVVTRQVHILFAVENSSLQFMHLIFGNTADPAARGRAEIQEDDDSPIGSAYALVHEKTAGGMAFIFDVFNGDANPLDEDSHHVVASNGSSTAPAVLFLFAGFDATPE